MFKYYYVYKVEIVKRKGCRKLVRQPLLYICLNSSYFQQSSMIIIVLQSFRKR